MPVAFRSFLFALTCAAYAVGTFAFALRDRTDKSDARAPAYARWVLLAGVTAHGFLIAAACMQHVATSAVTLSTVGLAIALGFLLVRQWSPRSDWLASVALPAATLLAVVGEALSARAQTTEHAVRTMQLAAHVAANVVGEALMLFAGASAGAYLVVDKRLKQKSRSPGVATLPSLGALDRAGHHLTVASFALITVGLALAPAGGLAITGSLAVRMRTLFGVLTWVVLAVVLGARTFGGWRGRKSAMGTLVSFAFALLVLVAYAIRSNSGGAP